MVFSALSVLGIPTFGYPYLVQALRCDYSVNGASTLKNPSYDGARFVGARTPSDLVGEGGEVENYPTA